MTPLSRPLRFPVVGLRLCCLTNWQPQDLMRSALTWRSSNGCWRLTPKCLRSEGIWRTLCRRAAAHDYFHYQFLFAINCFVSKCQKIIKILIIVSNSCRRSCMTGRASSQYQWIFAIFAWKVVEPLNRSSKYWSWQAVSCCSSTAQYDLCMHPTPFHVLLWWWTVCNVFSGPLVCSLAFECGSAKSYCHTHPDI